MSKLCTLLARYSLKFFFILLILLIVAGSFFLFWNCSVIYMIPASPISFWISLQFILGIKFLSIYLSDWDV